MGADGDNVVTIGKRHDFLPKGAQPAHVDTGANTANGINYHGGAVMTEAPVDVYYVFYGSWSSYQKSVLDNFMSNLGGTPYEHIDATYYDSSNTRMSAVSSNSPAHGRSAELGERRAGGGYCAMSY